MVFVVCYILLLSYLTFTPKNHIYMKKLHPPEDAGNFCKKLSMDSMIKNRINHPDIRYNDYLKINSIINNPDKIILDDKQHIKMFKQIDNKIYETILKTTKDKKENYLVSFHYSNKKRMKK